MKTTKLTGAEARDVMPTECDILAERGEDVVGAFQLVLDDDGWPSGHELAQEAKALFGSSAQLANVEPRDDDGDNVATWLVVRA